MRPLSTCCEFVFVFLLLFFCFVLALWTNPGHVSSGGPILGLSVGEGPILAMSVRAGRSSACQSGRDQSWPCQFGRADPRPVSRGGTNPGHVSSGVPIPPRRCICFTTQFLINRDKPLRYLEICTNSNCLCSSGIGRR